MSVRTIISWFVTAFFCIALFFLPFSYRISHFYQSDLLIIVTFLFFLLRFLDVWQRKIPLVQVNLLTPFFLAFLILVLFQYLFHISVYPYATRVQFVRLVCYWVLFHYFVEYCRKRSALIAIIVAVVAAGYLISFMNLWRYFFRIELFAMLTGEYNSPTIHPNRNNVASLLELLIPLVLGLLSYRFVRIHHLGSVRFRLSSLFSDSYIFILSILFILLSVSALGTLSKMSVAAVLFGIFCFMLLTVSRRKVIPALLILCIILVLVAAVAYWLVGEGVTQRFMAAKLEHFATFDDRVPFWMRAFPLFYEFPLFGAGFGTFAEAFSSFHRVSTNYFSPHLINDYLEILIETGAVGFLIWAFGLGLFFSKLRKSISATQSQFVRFVGAGIISGMLSFMLHGFFISNLYDAPNSFYFLVYLGMGLILFNEVQGELGNEN